MVTMLSSSERHRRASIKGNRWFRGIGRSATLAAERLIGRIFQLADNLVISARGVEANYCTR
jgi:hypothetical protein